MVIRYACLWAKAFLFSYYVSKALNTIVFLSSTNVSLSPWIVTKTIHLEKGFELLSAFFLSSSSNCFGAFSIGFQNME